MTRQQSGVGTKKNHSLDETIEGFRVPKATSKRLHTFLESEGITKKKWLESKLDDDLDYRALLNVNKTSSVLIPKIHYAKLLAVSPIPTEDIINEIVGYVSSLLKEEPTWKNYLTLFSAFCESSGFKLTVDEEITFTTINLQHDISEVFTNIMEGVWKKIANKTKDLKFASCIKTDISVIIKFEKIKKNKS